MRQLKSIIKKKFKEFFFWALVTVVHYTILYINKTKRTFWYIT